MDSFFSCTALNFVEFVHFLKYVPVEVVIAQFFFQVKKFDLYAGAGERLNIF